MNGQETEVKFYVRDLKKIELRLLELKAQLIQPRVHEVNYRYDTPDGSLRAKEHVLRLRSDTNAVLTFKGHSDLIDEVFSRIEWETTIGDLETGKRILEALGYVQFLVYEKYRAIYEIKDCHVMLDELPYGDFVEIEGPDVSDIRKTALHLDLDFESAVGAGYVRLFEIYNSKYGLPPSDLTFEALREKKPTPEELDIHAAD
mgnify:CR=1 FL=1